VEEDQSRTVQDYAGIYRELAEIIGAENVYLIYKNMRGQQITFPKKLYTTECIIKKVMKEYNGKNIKQLAVKYEYTERHLRKLIKEFMEK
jgi:Uncharacterized conserved protein